MTVLRALINQATPGPWRWYGRASDDIFLATVKWGRRFVLQCPMSTDDTPPQPLFQVYEDREGEDPLTWSGRMTPAGEISVVPRTYRDDIEGIDNADARLIAAAPVLADLLDRAMAELDAWNEGKPDVIMTAELLADFDVLCAQLTKEEDKT